MAPTGSLTDKWMWNPELLRIATIVFVVGAVVVAAGSYPKFGPNALYFLLFALVAPLNWSIYGVVGRKVQAVKASLAAEGRGAPDGTSEMAECLMVIGKIQSPGVAVLREAELVLAPIVGERRTVLLRDIRSVRETGNMFGKGFVWKRALILQVDGTPRLAFAVPLPVAQRWWGRLTRGQSRS